MTRKRMPGKRWSGGMERWERDKALVIGRLKESYARMMTTEARDPYLRAQAFAENRFAMGLWERWEGNEATARELFAEAAATIDAFVEQLLLGPPVRGTTAFTEPTELGAMGAALSGQELLAHKLFAQAELFATDLLTGEEAEPGSYEDVLDKPNAVLPYMRAYSLIRLGKLSGFKAYIYTVPLPQARKATPVWTTTDIHQQLDTANLCFELWRHAGRGGLDRLKKKKLEPLLRALVACLSPSAGETERLAARRALQHYQDSISNLAHIMKIYSRVLDLHAAYPHIFG